MMEKNGEKKKMEKVRACVYSNAESNRGPFANSILIYLFVLKERKQIILIIM